MSTAAPPHRAHRASSSSAWTIARPSSERRGPWPDESALRECSAQRRGHPRARSRASGGHDAPPPRPRPVCPPACTAGIPPDARPGRRRTARIPRGEAQPRHPGPQRGGRASRADRAAWHGPRRPAASSGRPSSSTTARTDATWEAIEAAAQADPRIRGLRLSRNFGHQVALTAGLSATTGDVVVTMDADLQHPPETIPALVAKADEGYDVVYARPQPRRRREPVEGLLCAPVLPHRSTP